MKTISPTCDIFNNLEVKNVLDGLHDQLDQFVLVPAVKTGNNTVFVCKAHNVTSASGIQTDAKSSLSNEEIIQNHKSV